MTLDRMVRENLSGRALRQEHAWQVGGLAKRQCGWNRVGGGQSGHR